MSFVAGGEAGLMVGGAVVNDSSVLADNGSGQHDRGAAGVPGPGGQNHFVARSDLEGRHCGLKRRRAGGDRQGVLGPHAPRELPLEGEHLQGRGGAGPVPAERPARFEHFHQLGAFLVVVVLRAVVTGVQGGGAHRGILGGARHARRRGGGEELPAINHVNLPDTASIVPREGENKARPPACGASRN